MIHNIIESVYLSENKRSFSIDDVSAKGSSLLEKAKNKQRALNLLKSDENLKVRGKEKQLSAFRELEKLGIKVIFPTIYNRDILLTKLLGFIRVL
jgi:hypothetical protein